MMTPADWQRYFMEVSTELAHFAAAKPHNPDENNTLRELELLEVLDRLEGEAAAMIRAGKA